MGRFLLIHGTGHGAWCWRDLIPALEALGHQALAIDLPGHGKDRTPLGEVTMAGYAAAILSAIDTPSILVGHSMGGYPISAAAERDPSNIQRLVYLCAHVPQAGKAIVDLREEARVKNLPAPIEKTADGLAFVFAPDQAPSRLYGDCPDEAVGYAMAHLTPQSIRPQTEPVPLGENWARVPRSYIVCARDQMIAPDFQRKLAADFESRFEMDTGHSPFFADPARLAAILDQIAKDP